jgi:multidrug efflux pump
MERQPLMLMVTLATIGFSIYLYVAVPKGFFPQQDTGRMGGQVRADQASSFQAMRKRVEQVVNVVQSDPAVASVNAYVGGGNGYSSSRMQVSLKPLRERGITSDEVIERLRPKLDRVPGVSLFLQSFQDLRIGGRNSAAQYQFTLQSDNIAELNRWAPVVFEKMRTLPQLVDVNTDQQDKGLEAKLVIDRATASRLGISPQTLDNTLYDAFGQREVSVMYTQLNQYFVVMEVAPRFWQNPDALHYVYLPGANDEQVPLSAVTSYQPDQTALAVNHQGQFPSVTISFNLAPGTSLSDAVPAIENAEQQAGLPSNVSGSFQGTALAYQESLASEPLLILAALIAVYIVLGVLYEDLIHPITILSTLPSAGVGALLALIITRDELNVISLIGIILLIGIVKKNAIMMIDFALAASRRDGLGPQEAICRACLLRFRPIMMTTAAALGRGEGAELRRPLGIAVVGGLVFSQMLTLYTTPVVYLYMDRLRSRLARLRRSRTVSERIEPQEAWPG